METYGFIAGQDFSPVRGNTLSAGRPRTDHIISLDMAKELSMIQRTTAYGFVAGQDYTSISGKVAREGQDFYSISSNTPGQGGRPRKDHILTLDMAKELSMIQRMTKGTTRRVCP